MMVMDEADMIEKHLKTWADRHRLTLLKMSQNQWTAALHHTYGKMYRGRLRCGDGRYDAARIETLVEAYEYICAKWDKIATTKGFCALTGIDSNTISTRWHYTSDERFNHLYRQLREIHEESLSARLISSKNSNIGVIGYLNHYFGWGIVVDRQEDTQPPRLDKQEVLGK